MCQSVDHLKEIQFKYSNRTNKWYNLFSFHNFKMSINLFYDEISPNCQIKNKNFKFDMYFSIARNFLKEENHQIFVFKFYQ